VHEGRVVVLGHGVLPLQSNIMQYCCGQNDVDGISEICAHKLDDWKSALQNSVDIFSHLHSGLNVGRSQNWRRSFDYSYFGYPR